MGAEKSPRGRGPDAVNDGGNFLVLDVNGDGDMDLNDVVYMAQSMFMGGPVPVQGLDCFDVGEALGCDPNPACE